MYEMVGNLVIGKDSEDQYRQGAREGKREKGLK